MEVGQEEFCASRIGKEFFGAYHAVFRGVVKVLDLQTGRFKPRASVYEVIPGAVLVSAFAGVCFFRKVFPESAGIVGGECVTRCKSQGGGGGVAGGWEVPVWPSDAVVRFGPVLFRIL